MIYITDNNTVIKDDNTVYYGEIRFLSKNSKGIPFGFICSHNYPDYSKDIYFSFKCLLKNEKIEDNDQVTFMVSKTNEKIWALNVRKFKEVKTNG